MTTENTLPPSHIYEHPFNERMRLLLRLEIIFAQAIDHQAVADQYQAQFCLDALFALLNLTNRYELRAELLRELERIKNLLLQLQSTDEASDDKIQKTLASLNQCVKQLHALDSKHIDRLRHIEFLNTVKNRNVHDTGSYLFELPALQHWLLLPAEVRQRQIKTWLADFMPLKTTIDLLLRLTRDSAEPQTVIADNGVYIKTVDRRSGSHQLLRIGLPENTLVYPRVSGDQHRFAVRFMRQTQAEEKSIQATENIKFNLLLCGM